MMKFKRKFIVIFLFISSCNIPFGPDFYPDLSYLYVTSPGEDNDWDIGSKQSISWSVQNVSFTSVKIELYKSGTLLTPPIETQININGQSSNNNSDQTADSSKVQGDYDWLLRYEYGEGDNYKVRITAKQTEPGDDTLIYAESEEFKILCSTCPIYFQITSPSGGEIWEIGSSQEIKWETNSAIMDNLASEQIKIDLYKSNIYFATIADNIENIGFYSWNVANIDGLEQATNYKIRISSTSEPEKYGESYDSFALKQGPFIKLTSPNGGETWAPGSSHKITWTSANLSTNTRVKINLYRSSSADGSYAYNYTIDSSEPNDGSYTWNISSSFSTSYYYKIRIEDYNNSSVYDESDASFNIN